ncbi:hypothetical protein GCM10020367_10310 [Streptomyces sannanensis]|uniref:ATP-binding protein n=1 Tax=Streptomyces sannanensis TaxID=285536 RepID=A0ABP6S6D2_9ACTN
MARQPAQYLPKPPDMFDRDWEWSELTAFATGEGVGPRLGVVSGRRRQGKSFLLQALAEATGGFYFAAAEASEAESLHMLGEAIADYTGTAAPHRPARWDEALELVIGLAAERPVTIVIDEFPYLVRSSPVLPSQLQETIGMGRGRYLERHPPARWLRVDLLRVMARL